MSLLFHSIPHDILGVLFSGNCSEGVVPSFPCGFIKSYWLWYPSARHFMKLYHENRSNLARVHTLYRAGKVGVGWVLEIRLSRDSEKMWWVFFPVEIVQKGLFHRYVGLLKVIWIWYPSGRHLYQATSWKSVRFWTRIVCNIDTV